MEKREKYQLAARSEEVYTPSAPIDSEELFAGRITQIARVIGAVRQKGAHAIIFGERGVGKTSLANCIHGFLEYQAQGLDTVRINCNSSTTHSEVWHQVFRELFIEGRHEHELFSLDQYLEKDPSPEDIRHILSYINYPCIIIIDELDRAKPKSLSSKLADTIKTLSDHSIETTIVLVGVADSVDALIKEHQSIERSLTQIQMPRMSTLELYEIVDRGLKNLGMTMDEDVRKKVARLSQGLPHYAHLLSLHCVQSAIEEGQFHVSMEHFKIALSKALSDAQQSTINAYHKATSSPRGTLYPQVLLACALAKRDELGFFSSPAVRTCMEQVSGKPYEIPAFARHLKDFCEEERGAILEKRGHPRKYKYRFINPLLEPYVIMNGIDKGMISDDIIKNGED